MRKWIPALLVIIAVAASAALYPTLPERVATHWDMTGQPNGWSSRFWGAWMIPLIMAVIWPLMRLLPHIDPHRANYVKFAGMYEALIILTLAFMLGLHIMLLMAATGTRIPTQRVVMTGVGLFFVAIGLMLPRVHPNWFVGIRTPWTLSSELSWERTHKAGGPLFAAVGALTVLTSIIAPTASVWVLAVSATALVVFLFVYSYRVWKTDPGRRSG
ncbi:MAG: DUF1648 domain-containing protein [Gemmatimonadales bacterium]